MSDAYNPMGGGGDVGGPMSRPDGAGLPPKTGGGFTRPNGEDSVDPGLDGATGDGDIGNDVGGMPGEA